MVSRCRNTNEFLEANPGADRLQQSRVVLAALISGVAEALIILHNLEIIHGTLNGYAFKLAVTVCIKIVILIGNDGYSRLPGFGSLTVMSGNSP